MPRVVPDKDKKKARMEMRLTDEDKIAFEEAAEISGANDASEWARSALRILARDLIENRHATRPRKKR